jgi:hypothetical protein
MKNHWVDDALGPLFLPIFALFFHNCIYATWLRRVRQVLSNDHNNNTTGTENDGSNSVARTTRPI